MSMNFNNFNESFFTGFEHTQYGNQDAERKVKNINDSIFDKKLDISYYHNAGAEKQLNLSNVIMPDKSLNPVHKFDHYISQDDNMNFNFSARNYQINNNFNNEGGFTNNQSAQMQIRNLNNQSTLNQTAHPMYTSYSDTNQNFKWNQNIQENQTMQMINQNNSQFKTNQYSNNQMSNSQMWKSQKGNNENNINPNNNQNKILQSQQFQPNSHQNYNQNSNNNSMNRSINNIQTPLNLNSNNNNYYKSSQSVRSTHTGLLIPQNNTQNYLQPNHKKSHKSTKVNNNKTCIKIFPVKNNNNGSLLTIEEEIINHEDIYTNFSNSDSNSASPFMYNSLNSLKLPDLSDAGMNKIRTWTGVTHSKTEEKIEQITIKSICRTENKCYYGYSDNFGGNGIMVLSEEFDYQFKEKRTYCVRTNKFIIEISKDKFSDLLVCYGVEQVLN